jgi:3-methylcrotonyl-CoA carboxylase alpha subunit
LALAVAALLERESRQARDPWDDPHGWRLNGVTERELVFVEQGGERTCRATVTYRADGWTLATDGAAHALKVAAHGGGRFALRLDGQALQGTVHQEGKLLHVFADGAHHQLAWQDPLAHASAGDSADGRLTAPMPGKVIAVLADGGKQVKKGEALVIMEAMKMEHTIAAPGDGVVEEVLYGVGDQVAEGAPLLVFRPEVQESNTARQKV